MRRPTVRRPLLALGSVVLAAGLVGGLTQPASAAGDPTLSDEVAFVGEVGPVTTILRNGTTTTAAHFAAQQALTGNFDAKQGEGVFLYNPGPKPDGLLDIIRNPSNGTVTTSFASAPVGGDYQPFVGNFDGDTYDDIFWYAPGTAADHVWFFQPDGSHKDLAVKVNGTYRPALLRNPPFRPDLILWYGPDSQSDAIWSFPDLSQTKQPVSYPVSLGGNATPLGGSFGAPPTDPDAAGGRVVLWDPQGPDQILTVVQDPITLKLTTSVKALPNVDGPSYEPVVAKLTANTTTGDDVLFYAPGAPAERLLTFSTGGTGSIVATTSVSGTYTPVVGDFDGDERDDLAWVAPGKVNLWTFAADGSHVATSIPVGPASTLPIGVAGHAVLESP